MRIDKWLWATRLYKTRTVAAVACKEGKVTIGGQQVKPSREVRVGETICAKTGDVMRTVKVLGLLEKRVGAKQAPDYLEDLTPAEEYLRAMRKVEEGAPQRPKGSGRPTKKERRQLERLSKG